MTDISYGYPRRLSPGFRPWDGLPAAQAVADRIISGETSSWREWKNRTIAALISDGRPDFSEEMREDLSAEADHVIKHAFADRSEMEAPPAGWPG